jgi:hypothetical protein
VFTCSLLATSRLFPQFACKGNGKVQPRTGYEGPERELRYSSTLSLTWALDGAHRDSFPGPSSPQRVAIPTELSRPTQFAYSPRKVDVACFSEMSRTNCHQHNTVSLRPYLYNLNFFARVSSPFPDAAEKILGDGIDLLN